MARGKGDNMNEKRFEELKQSIGSVISSGSTRAGQIQKTIQECDQQLAVQRAAMNAAEARNDPEAYQAAFSLVNMYTDRRKKAEAEQAAAYRAPVIPPEKYQEISDFLCEEGSAIAEEERAAIWEHLAAIIEIKNRFESYTHQLRVFADQCERANRASIMGEFRLITVGMLPEHWTEEIIRAANQYFRPRS